MLSTGFYPAVVHISSGAVLAKRPTDPTRVSYTACIHPDEA